MRIDEFKKLSSHAYYGKSIKKLKAIDFGIIYQFISENDHLDKNDFASAVNRMFINNEKPKNFTMIMELLDVTNFNHCNHQNGAQ